MSLAALLNESIPHIFASLLTHLLATAWSGFQINHTASFKKDFQEVISSGACGVNLLPSYWEGRANAEYATLALNVVALVVSGFLTWKLVKVIIIAICHESSKAHFCLFANGSCLVGRRSNAWERRLVSTASTDSYWSFLFSFRFLYSLSLSLPASYVPSPSLSAYHCH